MTAVLADRARMPEARRAFRAGQGVVVTETPRGDVLTVYPGTVVNRQSETHTWEQLHQAVLDWRGRHPRQTFYVVRAVDPLPIRTYAIGLPASVTVGDDGSTVVEVDLSEILRAIQESESVGDEDGQVPWERANADSGTADYAYDLNEIVIKPTKGTRP